MKTSVTMIEDNNKEVFNVMQCGIEYNINIERYTYKEILMFKDKGWILIDGTLYSIMPNNLLLEKDECEKQYYANVDYSYFFVRYPNYIDRLVSSLYVGDGGSREKNRDPICTYIMIDGDGFYKIGKSVNTDRREYTLMAIKPSIKLLYVCEDDIESILHEKYKHLNVRGEWFKLNENQLAEIVGDYGFKAKK